MRFIKRLKGEIVMEIKKKQNYNQQMNIKFEYLEKITVKDIVCSNTDKWFNQTLCEVNSSVLRLGIFEGEYHMHKHENDDEVFFVLEGKIVLETERRNFEIEQYEGICVPKGTMHRPVVPHGKAVVLMIENKGIDPIGTL